MCIALKEEDRSCSISYLVGRTHKKQLVIKMFLCTDIGIKLGFLKPFQMSHQTLFYHKEAIRNLFSKFRLDTSDNFDILNYLGNGYQNSKLNSETQQFNASNSFVCVIEISKNSDIKLSSPEGSKVDSSQPTLKWLFTIVREKNLGNHCAFCLTSPPYKRCTTSMEIKKPSE